jgi:MATE family multidrug resistance protein
MGTTTALMVLYVIWWEMGRKGTSETTWPGWSLEALQGWGQYLSYGLPATAMICMEWWCYEVVILMAGEQWVDYRECSWIGF